MKICDQYAIVVGRSGATDNPIAEVNERLEICKKIAYLLQHLSTYDVFIDDKYSDPSMEGDI